MEIQELITLIQQEAQKEEFPIDKPVYTTAKRDPLTPILFAGTLQSSLCFFARDLGKDEVAAGQPLYGAAGKLVRGGLHSFLFGKTAGDTPALQQAADQVLLTNTVPYKPIGNKAFSSKIKQRFRPFLELLLVNFWKGNWIITLGTEALDWFAPYAVDRGQFEAFASKEERFRTTIEVTLTAQWQGSSNKKSVTLAPLPHPSPLNQKYYEFFPQMLAERLKKVPALEKVV